VLLDGREVPNGTEIRVDLCIVGGGPAGISIALQFARSHGIRVALVESGGRSWDARTQELSIADNEGREYFPLHETHLRVLGGTSLAYGGYCTELNELDFEERRWVPESGWPIGRDEVYRYAPDAYKLLGVVQPATRDGARESSSAAVWKAVVSSSPPVRFGSKYLRELEDSSNVEAYLHSTVVNLDLHSDGHHVDGAIVRCFGGTSFRIVARDYVLTGGGIEVPRLLLASNDLATAGIGNTYDNVGRYFQEHPRVFDRYSLPRGFRDAAAPISGIAGTMSFARLGLSEAMQRAEQLLDYHANISYGFNGQGSDQWKAARRLVVALRSPWRDSPYYPALGGGRNKVRWEDVRCVMGRPYRAVKSLLGLRGLIPSRMRRWVEIASSVEQIPQRQNRVTIGRRSDELGMPRAVLHWSLHDQEERTYLKGRQVVLEKLERMIPGLSRGRIDDPPQWPDHVLGTWHHAGTTRMHSDPKRGVVSADLQVHNVDNLFIASSSVFPTSGSTAPTLTIVCLALRLANHLLERRRS
jgi:choline dehydrogenase-like flavoprotein